LDGRIKVLRTRVYQGEETIEAEEDRSITVNTFQTNPATVSVKKGITKNMGNYESVRIDVMVSVPCYIEEIDTVYDEVDTTVDEMIEQQLQAIGE